MMRTILTRKMAMAAILGAVSLPLALAACGGDDDAENGAAGEEAAAPEVTVVASTTHVADLARNVGGDRAEVVGLLAANVDPHDFEPRPSDVRSVAESDLVLQSGGGLDAWIEGVVDGAGTDARVVELIESVRTIEGGHDHGDDDDAHAHDDDGDVHADEPGGEEEIDPHWWQDPTNAVRAVEEIRDQLIEVDPEGRADYEANADRYIDQIEDLDTAIAKCMESIPAEQRKLVSSHDSLGYFADRYDAEVVGAAIPALTTQAQPSAGEISELVEVIRSEDVNAIFPEAGFDSRIEQAIAGETDAVVGGELWADTLGPEGSGAETYLDAMAANARGLAEGFTRGEASCPGLG